MCAPPIITKKLISALLVFAAFSLFTAEAAWSGGGGNPPTRSSGGTVTFSLSSPQEWKSVLPGALIEWSITAKAGTENNLGLAFFSVNLVQDPNNPKLFDLSPGDRASSGMEGFDRPGGFTNVGDDPWGSAYGGTPHGEAGRMNLEQIGGCQNTFGVAAPPLGPNGNVLLGQDVDVDAGVGQGPDGQVVATGSFRAPLRNGLYTFSIESTVANILAQINAPPAWSPVEPAEVVIAKPDITIRVAGYGCVENEPWVPHPGPPGASPPGDGSTLPGPATPSPLWSRVTLPREDALLNRVHAQFRWPPFDPPPSWYTLWLVEDDHSPDPFNSSFPVSSYPACGSEPRTTVTEGLEFAKSYAWCITDGSRPNGHEETHRFTTIEIPSWVPDITITIPPGAGPVEPGLTLFNGPNQAYNEDKYMLAVDETGKIVFFLSINKGSVSDVRLRKNGRIMSDCVVPGYGGEAFEGTLDGKIVWSTPDGYRVHHEVFPMPGGNILTLTKDVRIRNGGGRAEIWVGDSIVEFDRHTCEEVWSWSTFDHYSPLDGGPPQDWTHGNAVVYSESDDCVYYSSRHFSRITRIDYETGDIVYNMGMNMPSGDTDFGDNLFSFQHGLEIEPDGHMLVYDNGNKRKPLQAPRQTKAIELAFDDPYHPTQAWIVWEYDLVDGQGAPLFCQAWGDADRQPGGNTLITGGKEKCIFEVDAGAGLVWKLEVHDPGPEANWIYRAERIPSLIVDMPGDCDGDWDIDLFDLAPFQVGFTGSGWGQLSFPFTLSDCDGDGDIDADDLGCFVYWMTRPV